MIVVHVGESSEIDLEKTISKKISGFIESINDLGSFDTKDFQVWFTAPSISNSDDGDNFVTLLFDGSNGSTIKKDYNFIIDDLGGLGTAVYGTLQDEIMGGAVKVNIFYAMAGNDTVLGRGGDDRLNGGIGNDILNGGIGNDILTGESGKDRFLFANGSGDDVITDYTEGVDVIKYAGAVMDVGQLQSLSTDSDAGTLVTFNGATVLLEGFHWNSLV